MPTFENLWSLFYDHGAATITSTNVQRYGAVSRRKLLSRRKTSTFLGVLPYFYRTFIVLSSYFRRPFFEFQGN